MKRIRKASVYRLVLNKGCLLTISRLLLILMYDAGDLHSARALSRELRTEPYEWNQNRIQFQMYDVTTEAEMLERFYARQVPVIFDYTAACVV